MYSQNRNELRQMYFDVWEKHQGKKPLTPLECIVADVIRVHPEYHRLLSTQNTAIEKNFTESNPFLHLSLHVALREQIKANTPPNVASIYTSLIAHGADSHKVEHQMIECLAAVLWNSQRSATPPDQASYIECLMRLMTKIAH